MALWRQIGGTTILSGGATVTWEIVYGFGRDVGPIVAYPNIAEPVTDAELVTLEPGVVARRGSGDNESIHYSVKVRNTSAKPIEHNLNIGDWQ